MNAPALSAPDLTTRSDRRALLVLIAGAVAIGWSPILVRLGRTGPAATGFWRLAFALPWLGFLVARPGAAGDALGALKTPMIWLCALFFALDLGFWHYGIHFTSVANATVLSNLTPILVTVFAWLVLKEAPEPLFLLGMALAIAGAVGMAVFKGGVDGRPPSFLGDFLSVLTAVWYGAYFLVVRRVRETFSTAAVMWGTSLIGLAPLLLAAVLLREPLTPVDTGGVGRAGSARLCACDRPGFHRLGAGTPAHLAGGGGGAGAAGGGGTARLVAVRRSHDAHAERLRSLGAGGRGGGPALGPQAPAGGSAGSLSSNKTGADVIHQRPRISIVEAGPTASAGSSRRPCRARSGLRTPRAGLR